MDKDFSQLRFRRITDAILIPRYLLEQTKGLPFEIDRFYKFFDFYGQSALCFLFVILDPENAECPQRGAIWASIDPISNALHVHLISVHKDLQRTGFVKERVVPFLEEIIKKSGLKGGYWATTRPKAVMRMFPKYKKSQLTVMEMEVDHA